MPRKEHIPQQRQKLRCAIYTRKSSEEGLEQSFNSLHAQRDACEAFVHSQKHEGWVLLPTASKGVSLPPSESDPAALPPVPSKRSWASLAALVEPYPPPTTAAASTAACAISSLSPNVL